MRIAELIQRWSKEGHARTDVRAYTVHLPLRDAARQAVISPLTLGPCSGGSGPAARRFSGPGSRDASALPGRIDWTVGMKGLGLELQATHACCLFGSTKVQIQPGLGRLDIVLPAAPAGIGQWPAAWLSGLGTPWNTLQLGGSMRLSTPGAARIEYVQGRWRLDGQLTLDLSNVSSRVATLDELGSYRVTMAGSQATGNAATLNVTTTAGALVVNGQGQWTGPTLRFRGEAVAAEGAESALNNLLNIIGRRQGARSVISIG